MPVSSSPKRHSGGDMASKTARPGRPSRVVSWEHFTLQDYRMEITILERQNKRRQPSIHQDHGTGGRTSHDGTERSAPNRGNGRAQTPGIDSNNSIGSVIDPARGSEGSRRLAGTNSQLEYATNCEEVARLLIVHLLKATLDNASQCLQQNPSWLQNRSRLKEFLCEDEVALQLYQEQLNKKEAEVHTLDEKYEGLAPLIPETQQEGLLNVKNKTKSTMLQDIKMLYTRHEKCLSDIQEKRLLDEEIEAETRVIKSTISETIAVLEALRAQVRDL